THNHETTTRVASSYLKTKSLPLEKRDHEDVVLLADAKVSSKHITNFLRERTGKSIEDNLTICGLFTYAFSLSGAAITPQSNLIREIMTKNLERIA
ncbi:Glycoside-Pentoside-Hexuronide family transporter, partial [Phytophthora megakarya]